MVSAIESDRHQPNVQAALSLSNALGVSVEELFGNSGDADTRPRVEATLASGTAVMTARVGEVVVPVPLEHFTSGFEYWGVPDGVITNGEIVRFEGARHDGLVISGCDPVLGLLSGLVAQNSGWRIVTQHASTGRSCDSLRAGLVHGVVVHAPTGALPTPPVPVHRFKVSGWQVGLAGRTQPPSIEELAEGKIRVVQRDPQATSQETFVSALRAVGSTRKINGPIADGHLDVARQVSQGRGKAGVTMEAAAHAFGLAFQPLQAHSVELWIDRRWSELPAVLQLLEQLSSPAFMARATALGGYDLHGCGNRIPESALQRVQR